MVSGYLTALADGYDVIAKVDGDGQMDPALLPMFLKPILEGRADYTKGNRFYDLRHITRMPALRMLGNALLSGLAKVSTGYWNVFDPTNGYTAIDARVLERIPLDRVSRRYFFETDMLFRLSTLRAVVLDVPMDAVYSGETSSLRVRSVVLEFGFKHAINIIKRIGYNYFLRDISIATLELLTGAGMLGFGLIFGTMTWMESARTGTASQLGTIMLSVLPTLLGVQLLLAFIAFDMSSVPTQPVAHLFRGARGSQARQPLI